MKIIPINIRYETEAKQLVLQGFLERFGFIDETLNPDLNEIVKSYSGKGEVFLLGLIGETLVCTGAITNEGDLTARIQRMSVKKEFRNQGLAMRMLAALENKAISLEYEKIVLETNKTWESAVRLYERAGYQRCAEENEFIHMEKPLCDTASPSKR